MTLCPYGASIARLFLCPYGTCIVFPLIPTRPLLSSLLYYSSHPSNITLSTNEKYTGMKKLLLLLLLAVTFAVPRAAADDPVFTEVNSYEELMKPEYDGKHVKLNFVLNLVTQITDADNSSENGFSNAIYTRDVNGNPLKISARAANAVPLSTFLRWKDGGVLANFFGFDGDNLRSYSKAGLFQGVFHLNEGHPELIVADSKADEPYDYTASIPTFTSNSTDFLRGEAAVATAGWVESADALTLGINSRNKYVDKIDAKLWGCYVAFSNVTYGGLNDGLYNLTNKDGEPILARNIDSAPFKSPLYTNGLTGLTEGDKYDMVGIIEFDSDKKEYFFVPLVAYPPINQVLFDGTQGSSTLTDATSYDGEKDASVDYEFTLNTLKSYVPMLLTGENQNLEKYSSARRAFEVMDMYSGKTFFTSTTISTSLPQMGSAATALTSLQSATYATPTTTGLTARDGAYLIRVTLRVNNNTNSNNPGYIGESKPVYIKIHDGFAKRTPYNSVAELLKEFSGKTAEEIGDDTYVQLWSGSDFATGYYVVQYATAGNVKYIVMSDLDDVNASNPLIVKLDTDEGWTITNATTTMSFGRYYRVKLSTSTKYYYTQITPGDAIGYVGGKLKMENGNLIIDATGTIDAAVSRGRYKGQGPSLANSPAYVSVIEGQTLKEIREPSSTELISENNEIIRLRNLKVKLSGDNYYAVMSSDVPFVWDFLSEETANTYKQIISDANDEDVFIVKGIVLNNADGVKSIGIMDLIAEYAEEIGVCAHENHDTYYKKHEFAQTSNDKFVSLLGVGVVRVGTNEYIAKLKTNVSLDLTTLQTAVGGSSALTTLFAAANLSDDEDIDGGKLNKYPFNITGKLTVNDDGTQSLSVQSARALNGAAQRIEVYANKTVGGRTFSSYSVPYYQAMNSNNTVAAGADQYRYFYKVVAADAA